MLGFSRLDLMGELAAVNTYNYCNVLCLTDRLNKNCRQGGSNHPVLNGALAQKFSKKLSPEFWRAEQALGGGVHSLSHHFVSPLHNSI